MERRFLLLILITLICLNLGCGSNQKLEELEKRLNITASKLDSVISEFNKPYVPSPYWRYTWFDLGQSYHQVVNSRFYVSSIKTAYKENGFEVTGLIANLDALSKTNVRIECSIKDSAVAELLTFGFSELPYLASGIKKSFTVFVPTRQTKVSEIGVRISDFRM